MYFRKRWSINKYMLFKRMKKINPFDVHQVQQGKFCGLHLKIYFLIFIYFCFLFYFFYHHFSYLNIIYEAILANVIKLTYSVNTFSDHIIID